MTSVSKSRRRVVSSYSLFYPPFPCLPIVHPRQKTSPLVVLFDNNEVFTTIASYRSFILIFHFFTRDKVYSIPRSLRHSSTIFESTSIIYLLQAVHLLSLLQTSSQYRKSFSLPSIIRLILTICRPEPTFAYHNTPSKCSPRTPETNWPAAVTLR